MPTITLDLAGTGWSFINCAVLRHEPAGLSCLLGWLWFIPADWHQRDGGSNATGSEMALTRLTGTPVSFPGDGEQFHTAFLGRQIASMRLGQTLQTSPGPSRHGRLQTDFLR